MSGQMLGTLLIHLNLSCGDLAFALLGMDLEECPLPYSLEARKVLPEGLPWKHGGHNPRIFGHPCFLKNEDAFAPRPPSYPPPVHVLKSSGKGSAKGSCHSGPIRPLPSAPASSHGPYRSLPSLNADALTSGVTSKTSAAQQAPIVNLKTFPSPATMHRDGSRFNLDGPVARGFTRMGRVDPPFVNMQEYSCSRPEWHQCWISPFPLMSWLLVLEEHSFYIFVIKCLATVCIKTPSKVGTGDRELLLFVVQVCDGDLFDELSHVKVLRFPDSQSICVAAVIDHVRSILRLRVPLPDGFTFHRVPVWTYTPEDGLDPVIFRL